MTDYDIDEVLKQQWVNLNLCDDELISQQINILANLTKSLKNRQNIVDLLRYQGKFDFVMGKYEKGLEYMTKVLELEPNDPFALKYQGEIYHIMKKYEESLVNLDKLLEINLNETSSVDLKELSETNNNIAWILKVYEEVARKEVYNIIYYIL